MTNATTPESRAPAAPSRTFNRRRFVLRHLAVVLASGPVSYFVSAPYFVQLIVLLAPLAMLFKAGREDRITIVLSIAVCLVVTTVIGAMLLGAYIYALGQADWR